MKQNKVREAILTLLESPVSEKNQDVLKKLGFEEKEMNNMSLLVASVYQKALTGNASALKFMAYFLIDEGEDEKEQDNKLSDLLNEMRAKNDLQS